MNLVYLDGKKEPYTTSEIVAECADISHHAIQEHIRKQRERLERYGIIAFEMRKLNGRGRPEKLYRLNEQQATLLITFLKNTEQVAQFKENLVKAFFEMRDEVAEFRYQRALEKPKRKELVKAISEWENAPKHAHSTVTNLLLKSVTGFNAKQLRALRGEKIALNGLYSSELKEYQALENMVIAMIELNFTYHDIKTMVNKKNALESA